MHRQTEKYCSAAHKFFCELRSWTTFLTLVGRDIMAAAWCAFRRGVHLSLIWAFPEQSRWYYYNEHWYGVIDECCTTVRRFSFCFAFSTKIWSERSRQHAKKARPPVLTGRWAVLWRRRTARRAWSTVWPPPGSCGTPEGPWSCPWHAAAPLGRQNSILRWRNV